MGEIDGFRQEILNARKEASDLAQRVSRLEGSVSLYVKLFIAFNAPILVGIIGILLKMIFS